MGRQPIIFDCDGVLVDSEHLSWEAWRRTAEMFGASITDEEIMALTGRTEHEVFAAIAGRGTIEPGGEDSFLQSVRALTTSIFEERLETFEDGEDTVEHLERIGYRLAVASSSNAERLDLSLRITGLRPFFEAVVAGDQVANSKPAPDIYLEASAALNVDPASCVAVEDSPAGITSAKAAGMYVVAVNRGFFAPGDIAHADAVVPRLTPAVFLG